LERTASVEREPTSEPASGSVIAIASTDPFAIPPRTRSFCSSVPNRLVAPATIRVVAYPPIGARPREVSSMKRQASSMVPPEPPYSSGMVTPSHPRSAILE
jgi:hypothetical protein